MINKPMQEATMHPARITDKPLLIQGPAEGALSGMTADAPQQEVPTEPQKPIIGTAEIAEAHQIYLDYKKGKKNLDARIISDDQWYRGRHWEEMRDKKEEVQPTSSWLFNTIENKNADAMDNFPSANILPREAADVKEAEILSAIIPVVLEQNNFEETYAEVSDNKNKSGTGVYGAFWDGSKHGGLGDIEVSNIEILNVAWSPGVNDIQDSPHFFHVAVEDHDVLLSMYPQLEGKLSVGTEADMEYIAEDYINKSKKSVVYDWYYKKKVPTVNGAFRTVLHYCKFCSGVVLYASENDEKYAIRGFYDHGLYPFVFDTLYKIKNSPAGIGLIDVGKDAQAYIDRDDQILQRNMLSSGKPRYLYKTDSGVKVEDLSDTTKDFVPCEGNIDETILRAIETKALPSVFVELHRNKVDELKEVTGNRDISTGGTTSGVTAASAIAAMQEAGSKLSRNSNRGSFRAYKRLCYLIIELIRQFYNTERTFRIIGEDGNAEFIEYSNKGIAPQDQGAPFGSDMGLRAPEFDIEVSPQKASPYSKLSQNELALQLYGAGFFNPDNASQALACLKFMDIDRKQMLVNEISKNGTMHQQILMLQKQCLMLAQMVDEEKGTNISEQVAAQIMGTPAPALSKPQVVAKDAELSDGEGTGEPSITKNARKRVAELASP